MSLGCKLGWKVLICELILNKYMSWSCHALILNKHMSSYFYLLDNNVDYQKGWDKYLHEVQILLFGTTIS